MVHQPSSTAWAEKGMLSTRQLTVPLPVKVLQRSVGRDHSQTESQRNKQLQLPQWLHTLQVTAVFSKEGEAMWFGFFGVPKHSTFKLTEMLP